MTLSAGKAEPVLVFECLTLDDRSPEPEVSWLIVANPQRARELARRHLLADLHRLSASLRRNGRTICTVHRTDAEPGPGE